MVMLMFYLPVSYVLYNINRDKTDKNSAEKELKRKKTKNKEGKQLYFFSSTTASDDSYSSDCSSGDENC